MKPPYHILASTAMVWWAGPCNGVVIVNVKTQHNSTFTYRGCYNTICRGVSYCTIFEMIIFISSNRAIRADFCIAWRGENWIFCTITYSKFSFEQNVPLLKYSRVAHHLKMVQNIEVWPRNALPKSARMAQFELMTIVISNILQYLTPLPIVLYQPR